MWPVLLWGGRVAAEAARNKADARLEAERKQVRGTNITNTSTSIQVDRRLMRDLLPGMTGAGAGGTRGGPQETGGGGGRKGPGGDAKGTTALINLEHVWLYDPTRKDKEPEDLCEGRA